MRSALQRLRALFCIKFLAESIICGDCYHDIVIENFPDTRPEIATLQRNLLRQASTARKLTLLGQMNQAVKTLALSGLHSRYQHDSPEILRRRLVDLVLGPELARRVYGPLVEKG
jgi:hypothetical protein